MITHNTGYMTGKLLIAMPMLGDTRFERAIIYICSHDENGAMGLVINHVLDGIEFGSLLEELKITDGLTLPHNITKQPVISGGPVETSRGFLLHSSDFIHHDSVAVQDGLHLTGTTDALKLVAEGKGPKHMIFTLGYAGWSAGQLDEEIQQNSWLTCDASHDLMFTNTPSTMWDKAIQTLGIDASLLSLNAGHA